MTTEALSQRVDERLDYGYPLEFGYFLVPDAADPQGAFSSVPAISQERGA